MSTTTTTNVRTVRAVVAAAAAAYLIFRKVARSSFDCESCIRMTSVLSLTQAISMTLSVTTSINQKNINKTKYCDFAFKTVEKS